VQLALHPETRIYLKPDRDRRGRPCRDGRRQPLEASAGPLPTHGYFGAAENIAERRHQVTLIDKFLVGFENSCRHDGIGELAVDELRSPIAE
jgi:hypothetical protein